MKVFRLIIVVGIFLLVSTTGIVFSVAESAGAETREIIPTGPIVLVTGFEPFGGHEINPAQIIAETLDGQEIDGATIVGISVPVNFTESVEVVTQAIEDFDPMVVISIGLAAGTSSFRIERLGLNRRGVRRENGKRSRYRRLDPCGPLFRVSSLPVGRIARRIRWTGIPAWQSFHAGTYVCNALLYGVLGYIAENKLPIKTGFIHVPLLSCQDPEAGMDLETMLRATEIAIKVGLC